MKEKGMIVKVKNSHCIILTKDGTYHKVSLTRAKDARVGAEIDFTPVSWFRFIKPALMAASFVILFFGISLYQSSLTPQASAYVTLDINPSMELEVDKQLKVLSIQPLNSDAKTVLSKMQIKGTGIHDAIEAIIVKSAELGYLKPGEKNYILSTITLNNESSGTISYDSLPQDFTATINDKGLDVEIIMLSSDKITRKEAKDKGLSTGKYMVYKDAAASKEPVTLEEMKQNSLTELVSIQKVKLLPNNKKLIIKTMHIPPGKSGKPNDMPSSDSGIPGKNNKPSDAEKNHKSGNGDVKQNNRGSDVKIKPDEDDTTAPEKELEGGKKKIGGKKIRL